MNVVGCAGSNAENIPELAGSSVFVMRRKIIYLAPKVFYVSNQNVFVYHVQMSAHIVGSVKSARLKNPGRGKMRIV